MLTQDAGKESQILYLPRCNPICPTEGWVFCYLPRKEQNRGSNGGKWKQRLIISSQALQEASAETYEKKMVLYLSLIW